MVAMSNHQWERSAVSGLSEVSVINEVILMTMSG